MVCFRRSKNLKDHLVRARLHISLRLQLEGRLNVGRGGGGCKLISFLTKGLCPETYLCIYLKFNKIYF